MKLPRADAILKNQPEEVQEEIFALFRSEDGQTRTLQEVHGRLPEYGINISLSAFASWRSWYALERRMDAAKARSEQARLTLLTQDPNMDPEKLEAVAQMVFTAETLDQGDLAGYVRLAELRLKAKALEHDSRKLKLLEARAEEAKKLLTDASAAARGGLTEETLQRMEEAARLL